VFNVFAIMEHTLFFAKLLGIKTPWRIRRVTQEIKSNYSNHLQFMEDLAWDLQAPK